MPEHTALLYKLMAAVQRANQSTLVMKNRDALFNEALAEVEGVIKLLEEAGIPQEPYEIVDELIIIRDMSQVKLVTDRIRAYLGTLAEMLFEAGKSTTDKK